MADTHVLFVEDDDVIREATQLALVPFFHVTGMQGSMNGPMYCGNTVVILPRWDRDAAAECVQRYRVSGWTSVPTLNQDFFSNPNLDRYDLSSIRRLSGGGAAMPFDIERLGIGAAAPQSGAGRHARQHDRHPHQGPPPPHLHPSTSSRAASKSDAVQLRGLNR